MNVRLDPATLSASTSPAAIASAQDTMRYEVKIMTPREADALLKNIDDGDVGSKVFRDKVARFAATMREMRWRLNGDTVIVGRSGKVLDGRARLKACVESGKPFPVILVTGVDDAVYITIDTHSRRSAADVLAIAQVDHARTIASAWQAVASYLNTEDKTLYRYQGANAVGTAEIALLNRAFREPMAESAAFIHGLGLGKAFPATAAVAAHYLAALCDREEANEFFSQYADSKQEHDDPVALLRRRLEAAENGTFTYRLALFSKAWRAFMTDAPMSYEEMDFRGRVERKGNLGDEAFPAIWGVPDDTRLDFAALAKADLHQPPVKSYSLKAYGKVTVREVLLGADLAGELLQKNGPHGVNRKIRKGHAMDLARAMSTGQWARNGKTVKRLADGSLSDGQHRCWAVQHSGAEVWVLLVEGLDASTFSTLDLGERKSLGSKLRAGGDKSGKQVNSVCTTLWRLARDVAGGEPTALEAENIYQADKASIDASITFVKRCSNMRLTLDISIAGALHKLFAEQDKGKADAFMSSLASGLGFTKGCPVHLLRETLTHTKGLTAPVKTRAVIRAWNHYVEGRKSRGLDLLEKMQQGAFPAIASGN